MTSPHTRVQLDILKKFPLLVPTSADYSTYEGFLKVKDVLLRVSLAVPNYPSSKNLTLNGEWELTELLKEHLSILSEWSSSELTICTFLEKLHDILVSSLDCGEFSRLSLEGGVVALEEQVDDLHRYSLVLTELKELGTSHIEAVSSDLSNISLKSYHINDSYLCLNLKILPNYGVESMVKHWFEVVNTDLPEPIIKLVQKEKTITKAFRNFYKQVENLCSIWDSVALIDEHCWVIDPTHPTKADMYRRIFLAPPSVMAQLSWDPLNPNQPPDIKFQGADAEIDAFRCTYEDHLEDWNPRSNILENLCSVLQLTSLPRAPATDPSDVSQTVETGECCICYNVQLEGKLPEESCGKCLLSFHTTCLYEWLEMIPGSRQVHGHISGPCPNCETITKCPCPHSLA